MAKWSLESTDFEINPQSIRITRSKRIHTIELINGSPVFQEGRDVVPTMEAEITILTQTAYDQFNTWFDTAGQLTLIDDHSDSYEVIIESMDLDRKYAASHDYYYRGTITFRVFSGL